MISIRKIAAWKRRQPQILVALLCYKTSFDLVVSRDKCKQPRLCLQGKNKRRRSDRNHLVRATVAFMEAIRSVVLEEKA